MRDPIIEELHKTREKLLEKYNGDIEQLTKEAHQRALDRGFKVSDRKPRLKELKRQPASA